jgi:predicted RNase H-like nuclease (RuvC/YqgF family)
VIDWECTCQIWEKELIPAKFANKILKIIYKLLKFKVKMENKQTAVEWLIEQLTPSISLQQKHIDELKKKAKQMEKQQHKNTWTDGRLADDYYEKQIFYYESFNDYFKLEYGGKDGE